MGAWGKRPWDNDIAADWFGNMMDATGLAEYVEKTLRQELDNDDPGFAADEIRAAVTVLIMLGHIYVWPGDMLENHLKLAISRLEEILPLENSIGIQEELRAEISVLEARLDRKVEVDIHPASRLLSMLTNEMFTPLQVILGHTELLLKENMIPPLTTEQREWATEIKQSTRKLLALRESTIEESKW